MCFASTSVTMPRLPRTNSCHDDSSMRRSGRRRARRCPVVSITMPSSGAFIRSERRHADEVLGDRCSRCSRCSSRRCPRSSRARCFTSEVVDADLAELVLDHGDPARAGSPRGCDEQRRLAGAEAAGEHGDGTRASSSVALQGLTRPLERPSARGNRAPGNCGSAFPCKGGWRRPQPQLPMASAAGGDRLAHESPGCELRRRGRQRGQAT